MSDIFAQDIFFMVASVAVFVIDLASRYMAVGHD